MTVRETFDGSAYGLTPVHSINGTNIVIPLVGSVKVVIILSATSVDENSAYVMITDVSYSETGGTWTSHGETDIQGVEYCLYRHVSNVVIGNPRNLIAVTIDVPDYGYTLQTEAYRQINFKLHLETSNGVYYVNLDETITQHGCQNVEYRIIYTVENNEDMDMMDKIERNIEYFSGNSAATIENPAMMQYIPSRKTSFDEESDWNSYSASTGFSAYTYTTCPGSQNTRDGKCVAETFPIGNTVIPAGFYNRNGQRIDYSNWYFPDTHTVILAFSEPVKEIGYHTFCFAGHYNCESEIPQCDSSGETSYIYEDGCDSIISGYSAITNDNKMSETIESEDESVDYSGYSGSQLEYVFSFADKIKSIELNDEVSGIGNQAFKYLTALSSVTFGYNSSLTRIGMFAFEHTDSLRSIELPNSVLYIGEGAFKNSGLRSVNIPAQLERIECGVFRGCTGLTSVTFSDSGIIKKIGTTSFYGCSNLSVVTFPNSLERIEKAAFKNCSELSSVTFGTGIRYIGRSAFKGTKVKNIDLSNCNTSQDSMMIIDKYAFRDNLNLRTVKLPNWCVLKERSLSYINNHSYQSDEFIELTLGKKTILQGGAFDCLPLKKLTLLYESENDIANSSDLSRFGNNFYNSINSAWILQQQTGATLYINSFIWDRIKPETSQYTWPQEFRSLYANLRIIFIEGKTRGVFVKDPDTQEYVEKEFNL